MSHPRETPVPEIVSYHAALQDLDRTLERAAAIERALAGTPMADEAEDDDEATDRFDERITLTSDPAVAG